MRGPGHHATGFISGWIATAILNKQVGIPFFVSILAVPLSWWGGVLPDSGEFFLGFRWVRHRTVTHWVPLWAIILGFGVYGAFPETLVGMCLQSATVGFAGGGLTHLLFDWPNPQGIPFLTPWKRHTLNWWNSGRREIYLITGWALIASIFWAPEINQFSVTAMELQEKTSGLVREFSPEQF
jgi:membrane-bound metal-dependent hydrolase YbcI (DUF457 family)